MNDNTIADFFWGSFTLFKKGDRAGGGESGGWETRTRKHSDFTIDNDKIIADFFLGSFRRLKKGDRAGEAGGEDGKGKTRNRHDFTIDKDKIIPDFFVVGVFFLSQKVSGRGGGADR